MHKQIVINIYLNLKKTNVESRMKIEDNIQICLFYEGGVPKQSNFFSKKVDNKNWILHL